MSVFSLQDDAQLYIASQMPGRSLSLGPVALQHESMMPTSSTASQLAQVRTMSPSLVSMPRYLKVTLTILHLTSKSRL
jgi:hypothetical protein